MATKKKSDDQGGVPVKTGIRSTRHPDGVPVQVPESTTTTETATKTATKKGS